MFITHGGLHSTQESAYHGVKVLGLPLFADQIGNMVEIVSQGFGRAIQWDELTYELMRSTIIDIINDPK